jgi:hypothetical protein
MMKSKVNMVTLCSTEKFLGLAKVRFCNILCHCLKTSEFFLLKKDNHPAVILKMEVGYVIFPS